jgi:hypothetical protein
MWTRLSSASDDGVAYCGSKIQTMKWTFGLGDPRRNVDMMTAVSVGQEMPTVFSWSLSRGLNLGVEGLAYEVWAETLDLYVQKNGSLYFAFVLSLKMCLEVSLEIVHCWLSSPVIVLVSTFP